MAMGGESVSDISLASISQLSVLRRRCTWNLPVELTRLVFNAIAAIYVHDETSLFDHSHIPHFPCFPEESEAALRDCSIVCKTWSVLAREILFRHICLRTDRRADLLLDLMIKHPHIAFGETMILHIDPLSQRVSEIGPHCPQLKRLLIYGTDESGISGTNTSRRAILFPPYTMSLRTLHLVISDATAFSNAMAVLNRVPSIVNLTIDFFALTELPLLDEFFSPCRPPFKLKSLKVESMGGGTDPAFYLWVLGMSSHTLERLFFAGDIPLGALSQCLNIIGAKLTRLDIVQSPNAVELLSSILSFKSLVTLSIDAWILLKDTSIFLNSVPVTLRNLILAETEDIRPIKKRYAPLELAFENPSLCKRLCRLDLLRFDIGNPLCAYVDVDEYLQLRCLCVENCVRFEVVCAKPWMEIDPGVEI